MGAGTMWFGYESIQRIPDSFTDAVITVKRVKAVVERTDNAQWPVHLQRNESTVAVQTFKISIFFQFGIQGEISNLYSPLIGKS
jgi:hypothetical protein